MEFNNRPEKYVYYVSTDSPLFWPLWLVIYYIDNPDSNVTVGDKFMRINNEVIKVNK